MDQRVASPSVQLTKSVPGTNPSVGTFPVTFLLAKPMPRAYQLNLKGFFECSSYRIETYEGWPSQNYLPGASNAPGIITDAIDEETRQVFEFKPLRVDSPADEVGEFYP